MNYLNFGPVVEPRMMHGGRVGNTYLTNRQRGYAGGGPVSDAEMAYVDHGTGAGGREDNIPANLSENEYVIDAETVALLGDGNPDEGARKLDEMREQIRRHKGKALAEGAISDDAMPALAYCDGGYMDYAGGGRVYKTIARIKDYATKAEGREKAGQMLDSGAIGPKEFERLMHDVEMSAAPEGGRYNPLVKGKK